MTLSTPVIRELAAALGLDVPDLIAACARIEQGERVTSHTVTSVTPVTSSVTPPKALSAGALRTRKWRERQAQQRHHVSPTVTTVTPVMVGVTATAAARQAGKPEIADISSERRRRRFVPKASPSVTAVTRRNKKENPPDPLKKKLPPAPKGASPRPRPDDQVELEPNDPLFREIAAMRGSQPFVGKRGVGWFKPGEVAVAKAKLEERVATLRPSRRALRIATTGPPLVSSG